MLKYVRKDFCKLSLTRQRRWLASKAFRLDHDGRVFAKGTKEPLYQTIVGLEVHAQLNIPTKLFSPAPTHSSSPNSAVHPLDVAVPGYLPRLSSSAVQAAVLAAAALECDIQSCSRFERKHYAYADLPLGYQLTQQRWPLAVGGHLATAVGQQTIDCRITRIQLEQDTGKTTTRALFHPASPTTSVVESLLDYDRAGCALIEIVTEPDLRSSAQAAVWVTALRQLLVHIGVCRGRMQEGELRVDCNVNLECIDSGRRSPRVEVKNLNSIQQVASAIDYEALRQAEVFDQDGLAETRTWNVVQNETVLIRRKDGEEDYRFMPDPDLPPLILDSKAFGGLSMEGFLAKRMPELPSAAVERLQVDYGLTNYQAGVIAGDPPAIRFFDDAMKSSPDSSDKETAKMVFNLLCNDLFALLKEHVEYEDEATVAQSTVKPEQLATLVGMLQEGRVSSTMTKKLLSILFTDKLGADPRTVAKERGMELISDFQELREICRSVVDVHPEELEVYRRGGKFVRKMTKLFTGKAMAACKGNADPELLQDALAQVLEEVAPDTK